MLVPIPKTGNREIALGFSGRLEQTRPGPLSAILRVCISSSSSPSSASISSSQSPLKSHLAPTPDRPAFRRIMRSACLSSLSSSPRRKSWENYSSPTTSTSPPGWLWELVSYYSLKDSYHTCLAAGFPLRTLAIAWQT